MLKKPGKLVAVQHHGSSSQLAFLILAAVVQSPSFDSMCHRMHQIIKCNTILSYKGTLKETKESEISLLDFITEFTVILDQNGLVILTTVTLATS